MVLTNPILQKKIKDLTWEDKRELVAAKYIHWIINDGYQGDYSFLYGLITGTGLVQLTEDNKKVTEYEFTEIFFGDYQSAVENTDDFEELTVKELLEACGTTSDSTDYL